MNIKVEELKKRVRLTPDEITGDVWELGNSTVCETGEVPSFRQYFEWGAEAQLNKALNDPDLALIDRGCIIENLRLLARCKKGDKLPSISDCIILLADAVKEVKT